VKHLPVAILIIMLTATVLCPTASSATNESIARQLMTQLGRYGPSDPDSAERQKALLEINSLFLNDSLGPLRILVKDMVSTALSEATGSQPSGTKAWYFWNMGYIIKAKGQVLGFDIAELQLSPLNWEQKKLLAENLNILFVSHVDNPHIDRDIVSLMRADSFVVCPAEDVSFFDTVLDRKCTILGIKAGDERQVGSATVHAYPGDHAYPQEQGGSNMRCFLVSIGGIKLLQTGDQRTVADWMKEVAGKSLDVLMINPLWQYNWTVEAIKTMKPPCVLPGTMYDMSHAKDTWDGYPYAYRIREDVGPEVFPMFFGEELSIQASSPGSIPLALVGLVVASGLVGGSGAVLWTRRRRPNAGSPKPKRPAQLDCKKRYVPEVCVTCKHYTLKGGRIHCSKHNIRLDSEP